MPEAVAKRYRQGEETISEDHQDVSVVYADIVGFDALSAQLPSDRSLALLNELVRSFDEAAIRLGEEKIRTLRTGYLASVGLTVPRVDNSRRAVDFAIEMDSIVGRFNGLHATTLSLRAGVDIGTVTSGLVGRSTVVYDMWGDAVISPIRCRASPGGPASSSPGGCTTRCATCSASARPEISTPNPVCSRSGASRRTDHDQHFRSALVRLGPRRRHRPWCRPPRCSSCSLRSVMWPQRQRRCGSSRPCSALSCC